MKHKYSKYTSMTNDGIDTNANVENECDIDDTKNQEAAADDSFLVTIPEGLNPLFPFLIGFSQGGFQVVVHANVHRSSKQAKSVTRAFLIHDNENSKVPPEI